VTSTASVLSRDPARKPRRVWRVISAIAAATLGSGPLLMLCFTLLIGLVDPEAFATNIASDPADFAITLAESVIRGLIVALPAALAHVVSVTVLAHRARDAFGWSLASGAVIGIVVAGLMIWILDESGEFDILESQLLYMAAVAAPFAGTGALMGLLTWRIAIHPQRRWRQLLLRGEEAIRAME
jgi:hypothetical protein